MSAAPTHPCARGIRASLHSTYGDNILTGHRLGNCSLHYPIFRHPCRSPARAVLLLWPMCKMHKCRGFRDEQERQKSPKPSCPAVDVQGRPTAAGGGTHRSGLRPTIDFLTPDLRRFAFPARACKSRACLPWQARSAGQSMRYAVPASLWHRPKPSLAWAFGGVKVHRTFTLSPPHPLDHCLNPLHPSRAASGRLRLRTTLGLRKGAKKTKKT